MALLEPVKNIWGLMSKVTEGAESLMDVASSRGMMGLLRTLLDFTPEGIQRQVDTEMGSGIIVLLNAGDKNGVETALKFREYCIDYLEEMGDLGDIIYKFSSEDLDLTREAVTEMKSHIGKRGKVSRRTARERALESELKELRETVAEIGELSGKAEAVEARSSEE